MQHIEFFHTGHFENNYHRTPPPGRLSHFIDFFWETRFDHLWKLYPKGFSDAQFPNIGYTYLINLGTPFIMQVDDQKISLKTDGFLPRNNGIECFHKTGNHLFGIKFRISPVVFEKKINFSEYKGYVFPLSYLMESNLINSIKTAKSFDERVQLLSAYFGRLLNKYEGSMQPVKIVSSILEQVFQTNRFDIRLEDLAARYKISSRTLQRYFETCTGTGSKQALQVMRIRKAVADLTSSPQTFDYIKYGYYDQSHFYKHLKSFLARNTLRNLQPHLRILELLHRKM